MEVYILQYDDVYNGETDISVYAIENDALKKAVSNIQDIINSDPSISGNPEEGFIDVFNEAVAFNNAKEAVRVWNELNYDFETPRYYHVFSRKVLGIAGKADSAFNPNAGATCRKCNSVNEYASADQADGTYCCRQCSIFSKMFLP